MSRKDYLRSGRCARAAVGAGTLDADTSGISATLTRIIDIGAALGIKLDEEEARNFAAFRELSGLSA